MQFVHLHCHSNYSLLEGASRIEDLIGLAQRHGMTALALTDTNALYGAVPFYTAARDAGIKPIIGVHLKARDSEAVLLARNLKGYSRICRMVTARRLEDHFSLRDALLQPSDDIFILSSDASLLKHVVEGRGKQRPYARGDLFVEIVNCRDEKSRYRAQRLVELAQHLRLRPVATNRVFFATPAGYKAHRVLSAIRENTTVAALDPAALAHSENWLKPQSRMVELHAGWPGAVTNTNWIAERCNLELPLGKPIFPESELPPGETPFSYLWKLAFDGVRERYKPLTPRVIERLKHELEVIDKLGFAPYFLIVWDIVRYARDRGISVVGRGSAADSLVSYALGITQVDPFKYDLYFERFLNLSRTDCPDIDLDICWKRRDDVIDYVYQRYGSDRVAMISTFATFQARSAVTDIAKAFGLTRDEISSFTALLPHYHSSDIKAVVERLPECRNLPINEEPFKSIVEMSEAIDGFPRHLSIHCGGLVIGRDPLTELVPLQRAAKGIVITQYDMGPIEQLGLVKMDLLGHRSLTVIDETVEKVWRNRGVKVDISKLPEPDELTGELLRNGRTIGCFQIESPAMRSLLRSLQADDTDSLIKGLSLVRPGPSGSGMKKRYIRRHLGKEKTEYLHPKMADLLKHTYGVMLYQEDILRVASAVAGMTLAEGDQLRRAMTKKRSRAEMAKISERFIRKAVENDVPETTAVEIWGLIANFSAYAYCKAHACTYGQLAYRCAYLKAHYPAEFLASVLSNRGGFYYPAVYVEEARRFGLAILPPDINRSEYGYTAEGNAIRVGFIELKGLSTEAINSIRAAREEHPFTCLADLWRRAKLNRTETEALVKVGALDSFGSPQASLRQKTRPELLWELKMVAAEGVTPNSSPGEELFGTFDNGPGHIVPLIPQYSRKQMLDHEAGHLGMTVSEHPLSYHVPHLLRYPLVASRDMADYHGKKVTVAGWLIAERRHGLKGRGCMKFLTLEDAAGVFEAILFPKTYQKYGHLLRSHGPYVIAGRVQYEDFNTVLIADKINLATERADAEVGRE
jgi:DNA-directed DNA polymerase III PolC